jgi:hypothetical protein
LAFFLDVKPYKESDSRALLSIIFTQLYQLLFTVSRLPVQPDTSVNPAGE